MATATTPDLPAIDIGGTSLVYVEQGAGEPVVFVHGSGSDLRTWEQLVPAIARSHRAISYSRRYAWPNEDIPAGVDDQMLPHVDDLVAFLRARDAAPAHLVGHSWGGFICLLTAIRHPDLVRSLVLEEPPVLSLFVSTPPRPGELLSLLVRRPATALAILRFGAGAVAPAQRAFRRGDDEAALRAFGRGVLGKEGFDALPEGRRQQMRDNINALRAQLLGAGFPPLTDDQVRSVAAPTLLVGGERSPALFDRLGDALERLLPNATRVEIAGASHRLHEDAPEAVREAVVRFLAESNPPHR